MSFFPFEITFLYTSEFNVFTAGLDFIRTNFSFCMDKRQHSPVGFNIIFPGMIEYAREVGLELPVSQEAMHAMSQMRDLELKRCVIPLVDCVWILYTSNQK